MGRRKREGRGHRLLLLRTSEPKWRPRHFAISTFHFSLGAGVTPAEGSVKPTAGFTLNKVISPSPDMDRR
jgi:hypothetical protein